MKFWNLKNYPTGPNQPKPAKISASVFIKIAHRRTFLEKLCYIAMSYVLQHVQKGENPRCYSISPSPAMYCRAKVNRLYAVRCYYAVPSI